MVSKKVQKNSPQKPSFFHKKLSMFWVFTFIGLFFLGTIAFVTYPIFKYNFMTPTDHVRAGLSAYQLGDYKNAGRHLKAASMEHDPAALFILGSMELSGQGVPKDAKKAAEHFEKAANLGYRHGQYTIALLYDRGEGVIENKQKALNWALLAAAQGDREATYAAAVWLERGYSGKPEPYLAVSLYEKAAEQGHINAMKSLIAIYGAGTEVPKNTTRSKHWMDALKKANKK